MNDPDAALQALARRFLDFAEHDCTEDALYVALCRHLAGRPHALAWLLQADASQRKPNLLLAALHARVLAGGARGLRPYYASVGGSRAPDAELAPALDAALHEERDALARLVAGRATQTNEIGRCAVLWPALTALAAERRVDGLALLDFGCSAGLNLGVDRYGYDYGAVSLGTLGLAAPRIACGLVGGGRLPAAAPPRLVQRLGLDPAPVDVHDDAQVAWLRACLWPGDRERMVRLDAAVAIARRERWPVRREPDCAAAIEPWLDNLPAGVLPVVLSSFVLMYFERTARQRHIDTMRELARRRGLVWLSAEGPGLGLDDAAAPPPLQGVDGLADDELANGSLWWAVDRDGDRCLARSHPHGRWLQWFGCAAATSAPR